MGSINCIPCSESAPEPAPAVKRRESHPEAEIHRDSIRIPLLKVVFEAIDKDKSGTISYEELASFGQYIGNRHWTEETVKDLFKTIDKDKDGVLSMEEFQDFCFQETEHHSSERFQAMITGFIEVGNLLEERKTMIEAVYKKIDVTGSGSVNREEMMEFGRFMNAKFDEDKLNKLMDQMDLDKDGLISYHEFLAYFAKLSKPIEDASFSKGIQRYLKFEKGAANKE
jgi:Ca2+-binding EF-hand superfamily protein